MVLGHEAAGKIVELGDGVKKLKVGEHVVFAFLPSCRVCQYCQTGRVALCEQRAQANGMGTLLGGHQRIHQGDEYDHHHLGVSRFSEYAVNYVALTL